MGFCEFNQIRRRYHIVCMTDVPLPIDEKNTFSVSAFLPSQSGLRVIALYSPYTHQRNLFCLPGQKRFSYCSVRLNMI
jgi:hypothetical protein